MRRRESEKLAATRGQDDRATLVQDSAVVDFYLDDGESGALVRAEGARVVLVQERRALASSPEEADPRKRQFLEKHGLTPTDVFATTHVVRFTEALLEEGERATVLGLASWVECSFEDGGPDLVLELRKPPEGKFMVSDDLSLTA